MKVSNCEMNTPPVERVFTLTLEVTESEVMAWQRITDVLLANEIQLSTGCSRDDAEKFTGNCDMISAALEIELREALR